MGEMLTNDPVKDEYASQRETGPREDGHATDAGVAQNCGLGGQRTHNEADQRHAEMLCDDLGLAQY